MDNNARQALLMELLALSQPIEKIRDALARFGWDSDRELVTLKLGHVESVLQRYLARQLTANVVEAWAEAIEGREDIAMDQRHEGLLKEVIFQLANPALHEALTERVAQSILPRIRQP